MADIILEIQSYRIQIRNLIGVNRLFAVKRAKNLTVRFKNVFKVFTVCIFDSTAPRQNSNHGLSKPLKCHRNIPERYELTKYIPFNSVVLRMWGFVERICFDSLIVLLELKSTGITLTTDYSVGKGLVV